MEQKPPNNTISKCHVSNSCGCYIRRFCRDEHCQNKINFWIQGNGIALNLNEGVISIMFFGSHQSAFSVIMYSLKYNGWIITSFDIFFINLRKYKINNNIHSELNFLQVSSVKGHLTLEREQFISLHRHLTATELWKWAWSCIEIYWYCSQN